MNSLRSKLANKKVKGVFWPVVKSLWGVWAFFPIYNYIYSPYLSIIGKIVAFVFDNTTFSLVSTNVLKL